MTVYRVTALCGDLTPTDYPYKGKDWIGFGAACMAADILYDWMIANWGPQHRDLMAHLGVNTTDIAVGIWRWNTHLDCWDVPIDYAHALYIRGHISDEGVAAHD